MLTSIKLLRSGFVLAATAALLGTSGCSHQQAIKQAPPAPPPQQQVQQIQNDPNIPPAVKQVMINNVKEMHGGGNASKGQPGMSGQ